MRAAMSIPLPRRVSSSRAILAALLAMTAGMPASAAASAASTPAAPMAERDLVRTPVPVVLPGRFALAGEDGADRGEVPVRVSRDWSRPQPGVARAVVVIHGWPRRDLDRGEHAAAAAGDAGRDAIVVTPQFVTQVDVDAKHLAPRTLRWGETAWEEGGPATAPSPASSFEVLDAILRRLADRTRFPDLKTVVLAGHSAGGQLVQRYAAVGRGEAALARAGIHLRYVVANPATYLYFDAARPGVDGAFTPAAGRCPAVDRWKYGLEGDVPAYVARPIDATALARDYLRHDIVYLLGTADDDPQADGADRSCAAEAQGPSRLARGRAYFAYVHTLEPTTGQRLLEVPGVGHHSAPMYTSGCGLAALFDTPTCPAR